MKKIKGFDKVSAATDGFESLPAGGYVCRIERCEERQNKSNSGSHLYIYFDVAEGEQKGFFARDWDSQTREDKFWHGVIRQNVPDENSSKYETQLRFFKRFIENIEASNEGYHWDWDETKLKGLLIGVVFGEVERESQRGTRYITTQADSITDVETVRSGRAKIPAPRMLTVLPGASRAPEKPNDLPF